MPEGSLDASKDGLGSSGSFRNRRRTPEPMVALGRQRAGSDTLHGKWSRFPRDSGSDQDADPAGPPPTRRDVDKRGRQIPAPITVLDASVLIPDNWAADGTESEPLTRFDEKGFMIGGVVRTPPGFALSASTRISADTAAAAAGEEAEAENDAAQLESGGANDAGGPKAEVSSCRKRLSASLATIAALRSSAGLREKRESPPSASSGQEPPQRSSSLMESAGSDQGADDDGHLPEPVSPLSERHFSKSTRSSLRRRSSRVPTFEDYFKASQEKKRQESSQAQVAQGKPASAGDSVGQQSGDEKREGKLGARRRITLDIRDLLSLDLKGWADRVPDAPSNAAGSDQNLESPPDSSRRASGQWIVNPPRTPHVSPRSPGTASARVNCFRRPTTAHRRTAPASSGSAVPQGPAAPNWRWSVHRAPPGHGEDPVEDRKGGRRGSSPSGQSATCSDPASSGDEANFKQTDSQADDDELATLNKAQSRHVVSLWKASGMSWGEVQQLKADFDKLDVKEVDDISVISNSVFRQYIRERCDLRSPVIPPHLRLPQTEGDVTFVDFFEWHVQKMFSEEMLVPSFTERRVRQLARKHNMAMTEIEKVQKVFNEFDEDGSGQISQQEFLKAIMKLMHIKNPSDVSAARFKRYWREADIDFNGSLNIMEFLEWCATYCPDAIRGEAAAPEVELRRKRGGRAR